MRYMRRGVSWAAAAVLAGTSLAACGGGGGDSTGKAKSGSDASSSADQVGVKDFAFSPKSIDVKTGTTVTWTNRDGFDHSVQIDELKLVGPKFGPVTQPGTFSHRFDDPGTYAYICGIHNSMKGTVVVTS